MPAKLFRGDDNSFESPRKTLRKGLEAVYKKTNDNNNNKREWGDKTKPGDLEIADPGTNYLRYHDI